MNETVKHWMKAGLAAGLCLLLSGCGDKVEAPEAYVIGDNSAVPLDSFLTEEEGGTLTSVSPTPKEVAKAQKEKEKAEKQAQKEKEKAEKKAQKEKEKAEKKKEKDGEAEDSETEAEAEVQELSEETGEEPNLGPDGETIVEPSEAYTYTYEDVPAAALERYAEALTGEEQGFTAVDMERVPLAELPAFDSEEGSAIFAKAGVEENTIFIIDISWAEGVHTIAVRCPEGEIKSGVSSGEDGEAEDASQIMTLVETMDYVRSLRPADLGLEGESMSEYNLIPIQGSPLVDGEVCRHVNVYQDDPNTDTNTFIGSFLIGINKVYRLDTVNDTVEQIR